MFQESVLKSFSIIHCVIDTWIYYQCSMNRIATQGFLIFLNLSGLGKWLRIIMINEVFVNQILESSGIFRKNWGGRRISGEKKKKPSYFSIKLFKSPRKRRWMNCRNSYQVNWIMTHPIFSCWKSHFLDFFKLGKTCVCGMKFDSKLKSYVFVNKKYNWSIFFRFYWLFSAWLFFLFFQSLAFTFLDGEGDSNRHSVKKMFWELRYQKN